MNSHIYFPDVSHLGAPPPPPRKRQNYVLWMRSISELTDYPFPYIRISLMPHGWMWALVPSIDCIIIDGHGVSMASFALGSKNLNMFCINANNTKNMKHGKTTYIYIYISKSLPQVQQKSKNHFSNVFALVCDQASDTQSWERLGSELKHIHNNLWRATSTPCGSGCRRRD